MRDTPSATSKALNTPALSAERRALTRAIDALVFIRDNGMLGAHTAHWDKEGTYGRNCPACNANRAASDRLHSALADIRALVPGAGQQ